ARRAATVSRGTSGRRADSGSGSKSAHLHVTPDCERFWDSDGRFEAPLKRAGGRGLRYAGRPFGVREPIEENLALNNLAAFEVVELLDSDLPVAVGVQSPVGAFPGQLPWCPVRQLLLPALHFFANQLAGLAGVVDERRREKKVPSEGNQPCLDQVALLQT